MRLRRSAAPAGADLRSARYPVAASLALLATGYAPASLRDEAGIAIRFSVRHPVRAPPTLTDRIVFPKELG